MATKRQTIDDVLLAATGLLFVGLGAWTLFGGSGDSISPDLPEPTAASVYQPAALTNPETATEMWGTPAVRENGSEWLFDVFTPPVIYYDVASHEFSVTPPDAGMGELRGVELPFGLELVEVKRTPYRVQLVGYVGSEGDYIATFEDLEAGETFLGRPGRTIEAPGVLLRSFTVEKVRDESGGGTTVQDTRATAVIRDLRQDRDVTLVQKVRLMDDAPTAVLRITGELARNVEARQGGTVTTADATFVIGMVTLDPPTAEVTRMEAADRATEVRRLEPAPVVVPATPEPGFQFPATGRQLNPFGAP